ncbi:hypothetical protein [Vibrio kanaloae]|uniref:hypothetical protein n=1 Tax=Vibrio kanaloae TaxID=170673 RepID=UPI0010BE01A7|nr:hypothetical protein [Vibrio kanaloae]TKE96023.1 hypothetical protein FCV46_21390 [Vibrio kanaloae]TKF52061.1 hypothetical protein FCV51_21335 [Vibrio kanaloae]
MNSEDFDNCRKFLEQMIEKSPDEERYLNSYMTLIDLKSKYDLETEKAIIENELRESEFDYSYKTVVHTNNTEYDKAENKNEADYHIARENNESGNRLYRRRREHDSVDRLIDRGGFDHR